MYIQAPNPGPYQSASVPTTPSTEPSRASPVAAPKAAEDDLQGTPGLRVAVASINKAAKSLTHNVELVLDERSEQPVVRVVDTETGQLVRQIPTEEVLELRRAIDRISGLLIDKTA
jgi:flagellar protein FlaG